MDQMLLCNQFGMANMANMANIANIHILVITSPEPLAWWEIQFRTTRLKLLNLLGGNEHIYPIPQNLEEQFTGTIRHIKGPNVSSNMNISPNNNINWIMDSIFKFFILPTTLSSVYKYEMKNKKKTN